MLSNGRQEMKLNQYTMIAAMIFCALGTMSVAHAINTDPILSPNKANTGSRSINTEPIPRAPSKAWSWGESHRGKGQQIRSFSPSSIQPKPTQAFPGLEWKKAGQAGGQRKP